MKVRRESEVAQSCPTLSGPMDCSLPGSSVHGILQARVLEWGAIAWLAKGHLHEVSLHEDEKWRENRREGGRERERERQGEREREEEREKWREGRRERGRREREQEFCSFLIRALIPT